MDYEYSKKSITIHEGIEFNQANWFTGKYVFIFSGFVEKNIFFAFSQEKFTLR